MSAPPVDYTLDVKGELCPVPVLKAKKAIRSISPGQIMAIISTDPAAEMDIPHWARKEGHELVSRAAEEGGRVLRFYVRRKL